MGVYSVDKLMTEARRIAAEYRKATGKPLGGVSGEIAEYDAARLLDLEICRDKPGGYDALGRGTRDGQRVQIKGRAIFDERKSGHRIGQLKVEQEWDSVVLVLMDEDYQPREIYEATRDEILPALEEGAGSRRTRRGAMSVARFKNVARLVWTDAEGTVEDEVWEHHGS